MVIFVLEGIVHNPLIESKTMSEKPYTNEIEFKKTAKIRRYQGIFAGVMLLVALVGFGLMLFEVTYGEYVFGTGLLLYVLHIPFSEHTKKQIGWTGYR